MLQDIFDAFDLNDKEVRVYLNLLKYGDRTAGDLSRAVDIPRATLYDHLERLIKAGFVSNVSREGVKVFAAEMPQKLNLLYTQKIDRMVQAKKSFEAEIPDLIDQIESQEFKPRLQYFEGQHALHNMMNDLLVAQDIDIYSFWPIQSMIELMGDDYLTYWNQIRVKRNVRIKAIWPVQQMVDIRRYPFMGTSEGHLREVRICPKLVKARLSYMVYEDKVMFASSEKENYGFILQSRDMADMLIEQFMVIWQISEAYEETDSN